MLGDCHRPKASASRRETIHVGTMGALRDLQNLHLSDFEGRGRESDGWSATPATRSGDGVTTHREVARSTLAAIPASRPTSGSCSSTEEAQPAGSALP